MGLINRLARWVVMRGAGVPASWFGRAIDTEGTGGLSEPFKNSVWVQRAIKKVSGPIAQAELVFQGPDGEEAESAELAAYWERPAVGLSRSDFVEASVGWLKLAGETFWLLGDETLAPFPEVSGPAPLVVARPDRMRHVVVNGKLLGWEFTDGDSRKHVLLPEQVVQVKCWNPYDEFRGLGEYEAARIAAEADWLAGKFSKNLMANNGDTGPYIVAKNGVPTDAQREQILAALREKRASQQAGQFRPMFLTGDIAIEDPKVQAPDASFVEVRLGNRHEIFLAFGVPPSMADKMESYSVGSASDWFILLFETCLPMAAKVAGGIDQANGKLFGQRKAGYYVTKAVFDFDEHPVMQSVRRERMEAALKLWGTGMPMKEINDYLALGLPEYEGWEIGYLPSALLPAGEMSAMSAAGGNPVGNPGFAENDEGEEPAGKAESRKQKAENDEPLMRGFERVCDEAHGAVGGKFQGKRPAREVAAWRAQMRQRVGVVRNYESKIGKALFLARSETLAKIGKAEKAGTLNVELRTLNLEQKAGAVADLLFDLGNFAERLLVGLRRAGEYGITTAGQQAMAEMKVKDPFKAVPDEVRAALDKRENKLKNVPQAVYDRVKAELAAGIEAGETTAELAGRVKAVFGDIEDGQARTIAMTETASVYGQGRDMAQRQVGAEWKQWLTSGNTNVRRAHAMVNGEIIPFGDKFRMVSPEGIVDEVRYPGDPEGAPWNVINCHCVVLMVEDGEKQKAESRKQKAEKEEA